MLLLLALVALIALSAGSGSGQPLLGTPRSRVQTLDPLPPGIVSPDKIETRFGTLGFFGGLPDKDSTEKQ